MASHTLRSRFTPVVEHFSYYFRAVEGFFIQLLWLDMELLSRMKISMISRCPFCK